MSVQRHLVQVLLKFVVNTGMVENVSVRLILKRLFEQFVNKLFDIYLAFFYNDLKYIIMSNYIHMEV